MIIQATYILFLYPPTIEGSFSAKIGIGFDETKMEASMEITLSNCISMDDVVEKANEILSKLTIKKTTDFVLVYPPFQTIGEELIQRMIDRSWYINEIAMINGWRFDRQVPLYQPQKTGNN